METGHGLINGGRHRNHVNRNRRRRDASFTPIRRGRGPKDRLGDGHNVGTRWPGIQVQRLWARNDRINRR